jgi:putative peptidoglycan lipid II flippase
MRITWIPVVAGTVMTLLFIPLNYVLMRAMEHTAFRGHSGLALATSIAAFGNVILLLYLLRRKAGGVNGRQLLSSVGKVTLSSAVMGVAVYLALVGVDRGMVAHLPFKIAAGLRVLLPTTAGAVLFIVMVRALGIEESVVVWGMIRKRFSRRATVSE